MGHACLRLAAVVVVLVVAVGVGAVLLIPGGEDTPPGSELRVEREALLGELLVFADPERNVPATADGKQSVRLECTADDGTVLVSGEHPWPFTDTDGGTLDPHVHQSALAERLGQVIRCGLSDTRGPLEGEVTGSGL